MTFRECKLGFLHQSMDVNVFFGKKDCTLQDLEKKFPSLEFYKIKQTHSDVLLPASGAIHEADAHWSFEINKALVILTADCTPILIYNSKLKKIAAVHAGWRGIENQIALKTLRSLTDQYSLPEDFEIWVGPHILQKSFDVKKDVLDVLLAAAFGSRPLKDYYFQQDSQFFVNLNEILKSQLEQAFNLPLKIYDLLLDTKSDLRFNSFRRDKAASKRNISFIARLK